MKEIAVQTHPENEVALQELLHLVYSASCHDYMVTWEYVTLRSNQYGLPHGIHGNFFLSSGTTDILLQPEIYAAVIAQLKLVRFYRPNIGELCWQRDFRLVSRRISCPYMNQAHITSFRETSLFLFQRGPPVDERFWKSYCVDTDPYQWPYITIYLKDTSK